MDRKLCIFIAAISIAVIGIGTLFWWLSFRPDFAADRLLAFFTGLLALATLVAATAIVAAFAQVREARKALRDNRAWNRMNAALTYIPSPDLMHKWEMALEKTFVKIISRVEPISTEDVRKLYAPENAPVRILLRGYLNVLERYCTAVNCGLADANIADRIWGYKIVRHFKELRPYIIYARDRANNNALFGGIESVCSKWSGEYPVPKPSYPVDP